MFLFLLACSVPVSDSVSEAVLVEPTPTLPDNDADGFKSDVDCDDENATISPGAVEIPYDGIDNDCNLVSPDDDLDADGFGQAEDCNDTDAAVSPSMVEVTYDGVDNDCNAATLEDDLDQDGAPLAVDCNDADVQIYAGAPEACENGVDEDCDGIDNVCKVSAEGLTIAACSGYAPYNNRGATWEWEGVLDGSELDWTVTAVGASYFDDIPVWELQIRGSQGWTDENRWDYFDIHRYVTCEEDGVHLVADDWHWYRQTDPAEDIRGGQRFLSRPLVMPADLQRFSAWSAPGLVLPELPGFGDVIQDPTQTTDHEIPCGRTYSFNNETLSVWVVNTTYSDGGKMDSFVHNGYGLLYFGGSGDWFEVTEITGL